MLGGGGMDGAHANLHDPGAEGEKSFHKDKTDAKRVKHDSGRNKGLGVQFVLICAQDG